MTNSEHLSVLMAQKREKTGISIEELAERINETTYIIKDLECGKYNSNMELTMKYIVGLGMKLVLIAKDSFQTKVFDSYAALAEWSALRWPRKYSFHKTRQDANGVQHFYLEEKETKREGMSRNVFLSCIENDFQLRILDEKQIAEHQKKVKELTEKIQAISNKESILLKCTFIFCFALWLGLLIVSYYILDDNMQNNMTWIGVLISIVILAIMFYSGLIGNYIVDICLFIIVFLMFYASGTFTFLIIVVATTTLVALLGWGIMLAIAEYLDNSQGIVQLKEKILSSI